MDWTEIIRIAGALVAVLGLIGICALVAKRAGLVAASGGLNKERRLRVVETLALDAKRRAVILKCDAAEHLVILGQTNETLIHQTIDTPAAPMQTDPNTSILNGKNPFLGKTNAATTPSTVFAKPMSAEPVSPEPVSAETTADQDRQLANRPFAILNAVLKHRKASPKQRDAKSCMGDLKEQTTAA